VSRDAYEPFSRGQLPVDARTISARRGHRELPIEIWSPPAESRLPLVVFSHTSGGNRHQSTFLCSHLASHGYVVAAPDHVGNTTADFIAATQRAAAGEVPSAEERDARVRTLIANRVPDLRLAIDAALSDRGLAGRADPTRVGLLGYSFGGWAVLATPESDDRVSAVVAMVPAGNSKPLPGIIPATLTFEWKRPAATLLIAAELDKFTPPSGIRELRDRAPSPTRMFVLHGAGHQHFADAIDDPERCPPEKAHLFATALVLAHFDAALKSNDGARAFLERDPIAALRERGIEATEEI
jgi:predicted dienelactone hydrolase